MNELTRKQREIVESITNHIERNGYSPTVREVAEDVGIKSSSTIHSHLSELKRKGYIDWESTKPRTMKVLKTVA